MQIRRAELNDIEALLPQFIAYLAFYKRDKAQDKARTFLTENLRNERSVIFIAFDEEEHKIVGFGQLYLRLSSLSMTHYVYVSDLYVDASCRNQGIARNLMKKIEEYSVVISASSIQLETAHSNETAQALYESLSYHQDKDYRTYALTLPSPVPSPVLGSALSPVLGPALSPVLSYN